MPVPPSKPQRKKRILRSLVVDEISGVDKAAQVPARSLLRKRSATGDEARTEKFQEGWCRPVLTDVQEGHQHVIDDQGQGGETSWTRSEDEEYGHSHPWVRNLDGTITIGVAEGHSHALLPQESTLDPTTKSAGEPPMTNTNDATDKDAVQKSIDDLTTKNQRMEAIIKMNADERSIFDSLDESGQNEFITKSTAQRAEMIKEAAQADQIVYKSASGEVFRASDDARLVKMAREADEQREETKKALAKAESARLEKRASEELAHAPGTIEVRASILKALEGVEGSTEFLKAADSAMAKFFEASGTTGATPKGDEMLKAEDQLEVMAKKYVEDHSGVTIEKARVIVLESPEGQKLYAQMG